MIKPEILLKSRKLASDFEIELVESSLSLGSLSVELDAIWNELCERQAKKSKDIWDGVYYRLENIADIQAGKNRLSLSTIRYSTVRSLMEYGKRAVLPDSLFPYHVNTGALIRTRDQRFVFGKKRVGPDQYKVDLIGGGLQSSELEVTLGSDLARNMLKEMHEEINIGPEAVWNCEVLGLVLAHIMSVVVLFEINLNLTFEEVRNHFEKRSEFEIFDLVGVEEVRLGEFLAAQGNYISILNQLTNQLGNE